MGRDDMGDETVEVGVGRTLDVQAATADVVQSLVVKHDSHVGVLEEGVGGEHSVVWLHHGGGHLRGWVHAEGQLGLLAVVHGQTLEEQGPRPEPVPPPTVLKIMKPWRPVHWSASLRRRSRARSTISLPTV